MLTTFLSWQELIRWCLIYRVLVLFDGWWAKMPYISMPRKGIVYLWYCDIKTLWYIYCFNGIQSQNTCQWNCLWWIVNEPLEKVNFLRISIIDYKLDVLHIFLVSYKLLANMQSLYNWYDIFYVRYIPLFIFIKVKHIWNYIMFDNNSLFIIIF